MRRGALLAGLVAFVASSSRAAGAAAAGRVAGKIVLEGGHLPMPLSRAVRVDVKDFDGNVVGRVHYRARTGALDYAISDLPLGTTLLVELSLRSGYPETTIGSSSSVVPTLSRNDHSSPIYAIVLSRESPDRAPLDFRVGVVRDPAPARL